MDGKTALPSIRLSTYVGASPRRVYETLATGSGWDAWFTQGADVDTRQGGSIRLRWEGFGAGGYAGQDGGAVLEAEPPRRFVFQWQPGDSVTTVAIDLLPRGAGTVVHLEEWGHTDSPGDLAALVDCAAGWGEALTLLKFHLEYGVTYGEVPEATEA